MLPVCLLHLVLRLISAAVPGRFGRRYSVEPEAYDDHKRSLVSGSIEEVIGNPPSICDALQAAAPGQNTWPINSRLLTDVLTVSDDEVRAVVCLQ